MPQTEPKKLKLTEHQGSEHLEAAIKFIGQSESLMFKVAGGFSLNLVFQVIEIAKQAPEVFKSKELLWPEYADLDDGERAKLKTLVVQYITVPSNQDAEDWSIKVLEAIVSFSKIVQDLSTPTTPPVVPL